MYDNYIANGGNVLGAMNYNNIVLSMSETMRSKKFNEQYFSLNSNNWLTIRYNNAGDVGVVMVFEQSFLIDAGNETGHLIEYLSHHELYGDYRLFVSVDMIPTGNVEDYNNDGEIDYDDRVIALFASAMASHEGVNVEFELVNVEVDEIEFRMNISQKN